MTRVWSLSRTEETNESQLLLVWKNNSKLLSFDSGYESSLNVNNSVNDVNEALEFEHNFDDFEELEDYSNANEENRYRETESTTLSHTRIQSSPIPIPQNSSHKKSSINHSKSSFSTHSENNSFASNFSLESIDSVHCLIGHPPYDCGCVRGFRNPYFVPNNPQTIQSSSHFANSQPLPLVCNNQNSESGDTGAKKRWYPLPDIISSSQNRTLMNEIVREIGSDLRRMSKDFITTRNQNIENSKISAISRWMIIAIPYILKEVIQLF